MEHPAGESDDGPLRVEFDRRLKLEFHGSRITSDAGLLAYRDLDNALGLTDLAGGILSECRRGRNTRHLLAGLLRQWPCCMDQWEGRTHPYPVRGHAMRTDSGHPSSSMRFSA